MKPSVVVTFALAAMASGRAPAQESAAASVPRLLQEMAGTWAVDQRMWPGPAAPALNLPKAVARRRVVAGAYLEEIMELAPGAKGDAFTRSAVFSYNAVNQQYEYFSIDSRAPQMMFEKTDEPPAPGAPVKLWGGTFVAPQWGEMKNAGFRYRLEVGPIEKDRQTVRLFLTPQSGSGAKEFLAFEYVYVRRP